ncbi:hypothetical protein F5B22DRAFT_592123 [Xylaria bambusicola]|uniref:uncharacterized protein n=1 Tax=Xylaria bambusicola TaxID=326684 RepID=UPI0020077C6D|nr:uncharacterized protein F5B22DRAFT_592123 [Xylaria bambusicola]KAI0523813.1 hypothetical protein F5B22DRAFT_592123 [Xylaria bambusicola]
MSSSISPLADSTAQLIGAHAVVVSPTTVVKELLDNAIDAKATSIEILISPDTTSRIEVRDNGLGIHPDDFDSLGRHGHTSKLRKIEELATLAGKSLGFRGEALASINSVATVTITTKASSEPIAATFQLTPNEGGALAQKPSSAPVGTTVNVINLFSRQPVRQRVAVREAKKSLDQIQELLRSYIMARPQLRIIFKILHTPAKVWSYSSNCNVTVIEAALQLFGVEVASNCLLKTFQSSHEKNGESSCQNLSESTTNGFLLEVLLANPEANLQNVPKRHYCSIDGRPLNVSRGVAKRLLRIYLEHLKRSTLVKDISDCFIRLDLRFLSGSYDANVEPSKDDVLISNEQAVADAFRHLCSEVYKPTATDKQGSLNTKICRKTNMPIRGILDHSQPSSAQSSQTRPNLSDPATQEAWKSSQRSSEYAADQDTATEKSIAGGNPQKAQMPTSMSFTPINAAHCATSSQPRRSSNEQRKPPATTHQWNVDTSVDLNERPERRQQHRPQAMQKSLDSQDVEIERNPRVGDHLNPWVIAKRNNLSEAPLGSILDCSSGRSLTPEPPVLRHIMAPPGDLDVPRSHQDTERRKLPCLERATVPGGPYRSPMASPLQGKPKGISVVSPNSHTSRRRREQIPWTPPSSIEKHRYLDVSQIDVTKSSRADGFKQTQISFGGTRPNRRQDGTQIEAMSDKGEADKNAQSQDFFSAAKRNLNYQLSRMDKEHEDLVTQATPSNRSQRHHYQQPSRQRQPFKVLQNNTFENNNNPQEDRQPIPTTLPIGDPRAYLLRRQKSITAAGGDAKLKKMSRVKSSLMPLQHTPPEYQTYVLSSTISISGDDLNKLVRRISEYDDYVVCGANLEGLDMSLSEGQAVESQLQKLLVAQKENIDTPTHENDPLAIGLQTMLKGKGVLNE